MAAKGKGKGKDAKKPEPVYSDVNVCWKREKELAAEAAASTGPAQMDDDMKESFLLQINELTSRVYGYVCLGLYLHHTPDVRLSVTTHHYRRLEAY